MAAIFIILQAGIKLSAICKGVDKENVTILYDVILQVM